MRLLTYDSSGKLTVTRDLVHDIPPYAILSHTWGTDEEEVTFSDLQCGLIWDKAGYTKINFCGQQAQKEGWQYFWVDTCCIDSSNHVELSEAITSMFRWYQGAEVCYVYLSDVSSSPSDDNNFRIDHITERSWESNFRKSRWFTRGWTLQELLAPHDVVFFSKEGQCLGTKRDLEGLLYEITNIPIAALRGQPLSQFPIDERLRWTKGRTTKKKEDQAYCLLGIFNVFMPLIYGEGDNAFVRLVEEINKVPKVTFSLRVADGTTFDAYDQVHQGCHPATRVDLLQSVRDWTRDVNGKSIFWLNGMAGTGKSTISWTISKWLADLGSGGPVALGATFFFKRGEGDRASAALLFPTIARQLAASISHFDVFLAQAVKAHPQICSKSLGEQFNKLICEPLRQLESDTSHSTYVVVVDALDECDKEADIRTVLQLWSSLPVTSRTRLRLFLTSRPELVIRLGFKKMSVEVHQDVVLHEVAKPIIKHDILAFLTDALADIREEYNLEPAGEALAEDWPGARLLQELTDMAVPLFIAAATMARFVAEGGRPRQRLQSLFQSQTSPSTSRLGHVYRPVLQAITSSAGSEQEKAEIYNDFRTIVGSIILLSEPLSHSALAALLNVSLETVRLCLRPLHAVLHVPQDATAVVRPLHLSFNEYLISQECQSTPYGVDRGATHHMLWRQCLRLLSGPDGLRENVCGLSHPGQLRRDVPSTLISQHLSLAVQYACRYWVYHVQSSTLQLSDADEIHTFLQEHFIHWLEALSLLDRLADAIELVTVLQSALANEESNQVAALLEDARRFVLTNRFVGEIAPLQLYSSAIIFTPRESIIKCVYNQLPSWIQQVPVVPLLWSLELQKLEGHNGFVNAVAFSPDGTFLASASNDETVRLWQVSTGQEVQVLQRHTGSVNAVAFSPNGTLLASASDDETVRLWQVNTGQEVQVLQGHAGSVNAVAFSPDGTLLASASGDQTVRLWQVSTGREVQMLQRHTEPISAVAFSPDGTLLASASDDETVRLWQVSTGQEVQALQGHTGFVNAVAFSPDGTLLASAAGGQTVRLWQVSTGQEAQALQGHTGFISAVAFSPDGTLLTSASGDWTVRLWQVSTGQEVQAVQGHTSSVSAVVFSPDGTLLASASGDQTVRLWQMITGQEVRALEGHTGSVSAVAFSPDGTLLASASFDRTARLWQVSTGQEVQVLQGHTDLVIAVAFSPDGTLLASASGDETVRLWQVGTGQEIQVLQGHTGDVSAVAFSPDGTLLASAAGDQTIRLWQVSTGQEVQVLQGHTDLVSAVAFSPDGTLVASASFDRTVRLWQVGTGQEAYKHDDNTLITRGLTFTSEGTALLTDRGYIAIGIVDARAMALDPSPNHSLLQRREWIEYQGKRLLWLPQEYRACVSAVYDNTIAFGQRNGSVSFLRIDYP